MARDAAVAVVVRRGPSAWVQLVLWRTDTDEFVPGAWLRGRIAADKCDLSPDGQLFLYSAFQGQKYATDYGGCWTAISRPPWLHALMLWPVGTTYGGGGRFIDNQRVMLRGCGSLHPNHARSTIEVVPAEFRETDATDAYQLSTNEVANADWSGRDQRNRLVFAAHGGIFVRSGGADIQIVDFSTHRPDPQPAPAWAMEPIGGAHGNDEQPRKARARRARAKH
jgi:hypothetical protein